MRLSQIEARAEEIGRRAAANARDRIVRGADLPNGVAIQAINGGIAITGKRLRRRMIDNPKLRNFAHE